MAGPLHGKSHTISRATNCISYGLLRASHSRNPTGDRLRRSVAAFAPPLHTLCERMWLTARAYSRFRRVSHGFTLIPVAFEIAYSLLRALRVRRSCLRFRRAYTVNAHTISRATYCISPRVTSLLRSFRAANRYEHSRVALHRSMLIPDLVANVLAHW